MSLRRILYTNQNQTDQMKKNNHRVIETVDNMIQFFWKMFLSLYRHCGMQLLFFDNQCFA